MLKLKDFTIEYLDNPMGIDVERPRFSWKLASDKKDIVQKTYHIVVKNKEKEVWNSGVIESEQSICVKYDGEALEARTIYDVLVEACDNQQESATASGSFETGLMQYNNMEGSWITHGFEDTLEAPAVFKKKFNIRGQVERARVYASALGIYEFEINGQAGSDIHFAPGWTSYQENLQYQTYDITNLLQEDNEIVFTVGNGWYKGILGFFNQGNHYGNRTALIAQIEVTYTNGEVERICTDASWISTTGEIRYSELYHGEIIDKTIARQEEKPAVFYPHTKEILKAQIDEAVRITQRIKGQKRIITPKQEVVIDFGQNLTGVVEFHTKQPRGTKIVISHAEALDQDGNLYTANLRTAKCTDTFICSGELDYFRPKFTFHGFRYIAIEGLGEEVDPASITACVMHTDLKKTALFLV